MHVTIKPRLKKIQFSMVCICSSIILIGCNSNRSNDHIISEEFIHKYGFTVSQEEWNESPQDGRSVTLLKNGVRITRSFVNGELQGPTTRTFPHKETVEKLQVYDQGTVLKEVLYDMAGLPIYEKVYEFDDRKVITCWNEQGAPLSIEQYENGLLQEGKYYSNDNELEEKVESGFGKRLKRDRSGILLCRDQIENGLVVQRTSYHPNGQIHSISHYHDDQLHGEQTKYAVTGNPLLKLNWNHGVLHGLKTLYRNSVKIAEIPYANGHKHGTECHYDDLGCLIAKIEWKNNKKHGRSDFYSEGASDTEWFYNGQVVNARKFNMLENRPIVHQGIQSE